MAIPLADTGGTRSAAKLMHEYLLMIGIGLARSAARGGPQLLSPLDQDNHFLATDGKILLGATPHILYELKVSCIHVWQARARSSSLQIS